MLVRASALPRQAQGGVARPRTSGVVGVGSGVRLTGQKSGGGHASCCRAPGSSRRSLARTLAVADGPGVKPDKDSSSEQPSTNGVPQEQQPAAEATNGNAAPAAPAKKKKRAPKEKKEPWPLSRNQGPVSTTGATHYNIINRSQWATGVPTVMGGHMMPSGEVAPVSTSPAPIDDIYDETKTQYVHPFHYYDDARLSGLRSQVVVHQTKGTLGDALVQEVLACAQENIQRTGKFTLALSGGSLLNLLEGLTSAEAKAKQVDWAKVHVFWVDERLCALDSADSNAGAANGLFLSALSIPTSQHHVINATLPVDQAARAYEGAMLALGADVLPRNPEGLPVLDLVLLGMGPDGHIASLFPNRSELREQTQPQKAWILPVSNSPKPPSERITMTLDLLNAAAQVSLVAAGGGKAEIVQRVLEHQSLPGALPAQLVRPSDGVLTWHLDTDAAAALTPSTWEDKKAWPRNKIE